MSMPQSIDRTKQILLFLKEAQSWRSGEEISTLLGISRAAVAKHVASLRSQGHVIESASRRGYRFLFSEEPITPLSVEKNLRTTIIGRTDWYTFPQTVSTNNEAIIFALNGAKEGTVVVAEEQTTGRGTKGKSWFSAPRSLQVSVIIHPDVTEEALAKVTMMGTMALADAIKEVTNIDVTIKKPNDLLLNGKKIAGFLVETGIRAGEPDWLVLSFGCNVNTLPKEFPEELSPFVTSLYAYANTPVSRNELLPIILNWIEYWYEKLCNDVSFVETAWTKRTQ